jgi:hypothetical protein
VFRFPTKGGTGAIWKGVANLLPQDKQVGAATVLLPSVLSGGFGFLYVQVAPMHVMAAAKQVACGLRQQQCIRVTCETNRGFPSCH